MMIRAMVVGCIAIGCSKTAPPAGEVSAEERARAAAIVGELKQSLVGALQAALARGAPSAIAVCHEMAPALASTLSRDGIVVGRATRKVRNPKNEARGWQVDALAELEGMHRDNKLAGATFTRRLPDGRAAYAEPLVVQELCLSCHGANIAPEVRAILAEKYPTDQATGYAVGDLRGIAWVELPAR